MGNQFRVARPVGRDGFIATVVRDIKRDTPIGDARLLFVDLARLAVHGHRGDFAVVVRNASQSHPTA